MPHRPLALESGDSASPSWRERVVVAYLDEPPFGVPARAGARPSGCDIDLADHVLTAVGVRTICYTLTTFPELIPGLLTGRWSMTTGIFVTADRAATIEYSKPIWVANDGFVVRRGDAARYTSYEAVASAPNAILAVVRNQVQHQTALRAGIPRERIAVFPDQDTAASAVRQGRTDAFASTAIGNWAYVQRANDPALTAVANRQSASPVSLLRGAFAFAKHAHDLRAVINEALGRYLGSDEHLAVMASYGFSEDDLQPVLRQ